MQSRHGGMDDPLNLMRVMPTQGGQPCFSARLSFATMDTITDSEDLEFNHLCFIV